MHFAVQSTVPICRRNYTRPLELSPSNLGERCRKNEFHFSPKHAHGRSRAFPHFPLPAVTPLSCPQGFQFHTLPTGPAWIRPSIHKPLLSTWKKLNPQAPLRQAARRHPQHRLFAGRAPVVLLPSRPPMNWLFARAFMAGCGVSFQEIYTPTPIAL